MAARPAYRGSDRQVMPLAKLHPTSTGSAISAVCLVALASPMMIAAVTKRRRALAMVAGLICEALFPVRLFEAGAGVVEPRGVDTAHQQVAGQLDMVGAGADERRRTLDYSPPHDRARDRQSVEHNHRPCGGELREAR